MSIYDGLVICHPKDSCSTWDFCNHYIPHVKGDACSCDSCVPCDIKTVLEHRKKMRDADIAANNAEWVKWAESFCTDVTHEVSGLRKYRCSKCWQERKRNIGL